MQEDFTQSVREECKKSLDLLQVILDGESTREEEKFFYKHLDECDPCFRHFDTYKTMIEAVKLKVERKKCPGYVLNSIRNNIKNIKV